MDARARRGAPDAALAHAQTGAGRHRPARWTWGRGRALALPRKKRGRDGGSGPRLRFTQVAAEVIVRACVHAAATAGATQVTSCSERSTVDRSAKSGRAVFDSIAW